MFKTFMMLKPDAVDRRLVDTIVNDLTKAGLKVERFDCMEVDLDIVYEHYEELIERLDPKIRIKEKIRHVYSGKYVVPMIITSDDVYIKDNIIKYTRNLIGATEPKSADIYSIRGKYGRDDTYEAADNENRMIHNLIHASDSSENAKKEINLWFSNIYSKV